MPFPNQPDQQAPQAMASMQSGGGSLPPTGLQAQLGSLDQFYGKVAGAHRIGFDPRSYRGQTEMTGQGAGGGYGMRGMPGQVNLQQMARTLAQSYGLSLGRGELVDPSGNFLSTPDQLAEASGGQMGKGEAAAKMNYISQAIANQQNQEQQRKGIAALSTGAGLVQSRARGSLATMQSGYYRDIADMYANQEHEAADFSYFIQQEQLEIQQEMQRRAEKLAKKKARFGAIGGLFTGILGFATGNIGMGISGIGGAFDSAAGAGWF